ncbi:MAG: glycosyltransferase family 2 protein [Nanoarchaeota archaeon]|nr:glycosyltransferase family 2 protein [Nanoarchaeota archaeon]
MDLSVIIVNWNSGRFLEQCISSIYEQAPKLRFEILVVDNASSDQSLACLKEFSGVRLIKNKKNFGFAKANNQAIKRAKGRHILLLNPDMVVLKDSLEHMVRFLDHNKKIGVLGCKLLNPDRSVQPSCHAFLTLPHVFFEVSQLNSLFPKNRFFMKTLGFLNSFFPKLFVNYSVLGKPLEVESVMGSCYMIRRKALEKTGLLDENFFLYHEEMELSFRMWQKGYKVMFYPYASVVHYNKHSAKMVPHMVYYERCRSILHFFRKHKQSQMRILKAVMLFSLLINFLSLPFRRNLKEALAYRLKVLSLLI